MTMATHPIWVNIDPFGRKKTIMFSSLVFILGGILQAVAQNVATMLAGRFIAGCKPQITLLLLRTLFTSTLCCSGCGCVFNACSNVHCRNCSTSSTWTFGYLVAVPCSIGYHVVVLVCESFVLCNRTTCNMPPTTFQQIGSIMAACVISQCQIDNGVLH